MTVVSHAIRPPRCQDLRPAWALIVAVALLAGGPAHAQSSDAAPGTADTARAADTADAADSAEEPDTVDHAGALKGAGGAGAPDTGDDAGDRMPWVEGVPRADRLEARRIFQEGNTLLREGLFARAAEKYQQALARWDHPGFRYNLAIAQINLDQPIAAHENLKRARSHGPAPIGRDRHEQAGNLLTLLRNQLARIEVACDQPGAVVTFDGKPLFTAPGRESILARPGAHQLMADAPGRLPDTRRLVLSPGQRAELTLAPERPAYLATERRWPAWIPWTVTGAGLAIATGAGVLDWRAAAAFERHDLEVARTCTSPGGCEAGDIPANLRAQLDHAERLQLTARITYAIGGTVLAASAVLLYLNRERPVERRDPDAPRATLLPVLTPHTAGVSARIDF